MWFDEPPAKQPLKVNVFAHAMAHQGMLQQAPLFPYVGPGDLVPTAALSLTLPDTPRVHFYHHNDVTEVILCMASEGGTIATGQLYLQQGTHGVTTFLREPTGPEAKHYQLSLITFRMREVGPQMEGFILRCHGCNAIVFRMDRDIWQPASRAHYPELANLRFYADAADAYNAIPRTCEACALAQLPFPSELMGWRRYVQYVELANRAQTDLLEAG